MLQPVKGPRRKRNRQVLQGPGPDCIGTGTLGQNGGASAREDKKLTVDDLSAAKWVLREDGSGTRAAFVKALDALGVPYGNLNIAIELPSNEAVLAAVLAGAGSTILSERVCAGAIRGGPEASAVSLTPRAFYGVQHADRYRSRAVSALLEILRTHAAL